MKQSKRIILTLSVALCGLFQGCETSSIGTAAFYLGGYKATLEAIENDPDNEEIARFVVEYIDRIIVEDDVIFPAIEEWFASLDLGLDQIERKILNDLVFVPLWEELKAKYKGKSLSLDNPAVKQRILEFQAGMRTALS